MPIAFLQLARDSAPSCPEELTGQNSETDHGFGSALLLPALHATVFFALDILPEELVQQRTEQTKLLQALQLSQHTEPQPHCEIPK